MSKLFQLLFITLFTISLFNISSITMEENSNTQIEQSIDENSLKNEINDKLLNISTFYQFAYSSKVFTAFHIYATKQFAYQHTLLRPPISS